MGNCATRKETVKKNKKHQPKPRVNPKKNTPLPVTPEETKKDKSFKKAKEDRKKDKSSKKDKEDRKKHQKLVEKDKSSNKEKNDRSEYPNLEDLEKHCDKSSQVSLMALAWLGSNAKFYKCVKETVRFYNTCYINTSM